jgi:hypothetical protein
MEGAGGAAGVDALGTDQGFGLERGLEALVVFGAAALFDASKVWVLALAAHEIIGLGQHQLFVENKFAFGLELVGVWTDHFLVGEVAQSVGLHFGEETLDGLGFFVHLGAARGCHQKTAQRTSLPLEVEGLCIHDLLTQVQLLEASRVEDVATVQRAHLSGLQR